MKSPVLLLLLVALSAGFVSVVGCGDPDKPLREPTSDKNFDDPDEPGGGGGSDKPIVRDASVDREASTPPPDSGPPTEGSAPKEDSSTTDAIAPALDALPE